LDVALSDDLPHNIESASFGEWDGYDPEEKFVVYRNWIDSRFLDFYGIPIVQGRGFSEEFNDKEGKAYILNEAAVEAIGWDDPIGKRFGFSEDETGVVVGVVKNFHFAPLHLDVGPLAFTPHSIRTDWISIKVAPHSIPDTLAFIEKSWKKHSPEGIFNYSFLDDRLDRIYRTEQKLGKTFSYYTFIALFVACLGLFGLAAFSTEQRVKEIGIRKVLGATEWSITVLTTKRFLLLVLIANAAAWPIAYIGMQKWLENFAYRTNIGVWMFVLSAGMSVVIALLTVGYHSVKAALTVPADSLRYE
jgi:putative ABC transport system permease protein